jgi:hypothetical protein
MSTETITSSELLSDTLSQLFASYGNGGIPRSNPPNSRNRSFNDPIPFSLEDLNTENIGTGNFLIDLFRIFNKRKLEKLGNWVTFDEQQERKNLLKTLKRTIKRIKMDADNSIVVQNKMDRLLLMEDQKQEQLNIKSVF